MLPEADSRSKEERLNDMALRQAMGERFSLLDWLNADIPDVVADLRSLLAEYTKDVLALGDPSVRAQILDGTITMGEALVELEEFKQKTLNAVTGGEGLAAQVEKEKALKAVNAYALETIREMVGAFCDALRNLGDHIDSFIEEAHALERLRRKLADKLSLKEDNSDQHPLPVKDRVARMEELHELMRNAASDKERELIADLIQLREGSHALRQQEEGLLRVKEFRDKVTKSYLVRLGNYADLAQERSKGLYL